MLPRFHWIAGRDGRASPRGIGPDSIIVNGLVASAGEFEKTFKGDYFGVNADVSSSVGNDQWNGPVQQNFKRLYLGHIEVDSTEFWMDRVLSAGSF